MENREKFCYPGLFRSQNVNFSLRRVEAMNDKKNNFSF
jgi:hypothetical protein